MSHPGYVKPDPNRRWARIAATLGGVGLVVATATALMTQLSGFWETGKDTFCVVFSCAAKVLDVPEQSKLGHMRAIKVTLTRPKTGGRVPFIIAWNWTGAKDGYQQGYQTVTFDFKDSSGATRDTRTFKIDRSHCYLEPGHDERESGELRAGVKIGDIDSVTAILSEISGKIGKCF